MASIEFTGKVSRVKDWGDATDLSLEIEEGRQYPARCIVKLNGSNHFEQGDVVKVSTATMPYAKSRTYTDREGNEKQVTDIYFTNASARISEGANPVGAAEDDIFGATPIPF